MMRLSLYINYAVQSLLKGGQRTILAVFCVAIGVMSVVALQLVGTMISQTFMTDFRVTNGGDIDVTPQFTTLRASDLPFFNTLKQQGTINQYTEVVDTNGYLQTSTGNHVFSVTAVDPASYPVVSEVTFVSPTNQTLPDLLGNQRVVVDQGFAQRNHVRIGDTIHINLSNSQLRNASMQATVAGIVANSGLLAQRNDFLLVALQDYQTATGQPLSFTSIYISTNQNQARMNQANLAIQERFPLVNTTTTDDIVRDQQNNIGLIQKFLNIAGLLALLVGGVGIINTMQVLLSRRKIEIATLKTNGYGKRDLYILFGVEAALLGLIGGIIGAAFSIGISYLIRLLVQRFFSSFTIPFILNWGIIGGGIMIGVGTTLIFGLMPIVQAASVRPLSVIREEADARSFGSGALTAFLLLALSVLFCIMSILILNDPLWGVLSVYGGFVLLGLLSLVFTLVVLFIGKLPVPDRYSAGYLIFVTVCTVLSVILCFVLGTFGYLLLTISLMGYLVVLLPRSWKISARMAVRNIGRQRMRTSTTLLALFIGVFTIGCNIVLGQNFIAQFNALRNSGSSYNIAMLTNEQDAQTFASQQSSVPGLMVDHTRERTYLTVSPISLDGQSMNQVLPARDINYQSPIHGFDRNDIIHMLSSFEGYDLAHNQFPDLKNDMDITNGRTLNAGDINSNNVLIQWDVANVGGLRGKIHVGSDLVVASQDGKTSKTLHIVGIYKPKIFAYVGKLLASNELVKSLAPANQPLSIFYLRVNPLQIGKAIDRINQLVPNANVENFVAFGDQINQYVDDSISLLVGLASLSMLAGIIIIANSVALAMLERRREIGILKSVGYTSRMIIGEVILENGVVGGTGAFLGMLLVAFASGIVGRFLNINVHVDWSVAMGIIVGVASVAILTSIIVAWQSARVRPLEILRYE